MRSRSSFFMLALLLLIYIFGAFTSVNVLLHSTINLIYEDEATQSNLYIYITAHSFCESHKQS